MLHEHDSALGAAHRTHKLPVSLKMICSTRRRPWRTSATSRPSRGGRGCSRGSMNSARSSRRRWIRGRTPSTHSERPLKNRPTSAEEEEEESEESLQCCDPVRDALNKMKDVYEKNPQMGDPSSLQPKISETICNMEKLRSEIHKNEVRETIGVDDGE